MIFFHLTFLLPSLTIVATLFNSYTMSLRITSPLILLVFLTTLASCSGTFSDTMRITNDTGSTSTSVTTPSPVSTPSTMPTPIPSATTTSPSKTKKAQISYSVPEGGTSTTEFSVTVSDGVIDSVSALRVSGDRESKQYQDAFARKVAGSVVGRKLTDLNLHAL